MGTYINLGNRAWRNARNGEYVDKSGLIAIVNSTLNTKMQFSCVTRSRRFGKTMAAEMLYAYYDKWCDSRELFADLEIARHPTFEVYLNKYPVIYLDITNFLSRDIPAIDIVPVLQREVKEEIESSYPEVAFKEEEDLMVSLVRIVEHTGEQFIMIIDEWDSICREALGDEAAMDRYVKLLRRLFKGSNSAQVFAGVYMTGILPIKKYKTESALNNFIEYSMVKPGEMAQYFGFTKNEVRALAAKHGMDFNELEKWYDGYQIGPEPSMFNPNSVMQAVRQGWCESFWASTGSFDAVAGYIGKNFDGLKDDIICMIGGGRVKVNTTKFQNDMSVVRSKDDILTVLIHIGYLSFNWEKKECYVPNMEAEGELINAIEENHWEHVMQALEQSEALLNATLRGDSDTVARMLERYHSDDTSILSYNDENSLACVISIAYYYARNDYVIHREYPTGSGYADMVLMPRKNVTTPALIVELKKDRNVRAAIAQIKERNYPQQVEKYTGDILLVGINYDEDTKKHECLIERWHKD